MSELPGTSNELVACANQVVLVPGHRTVDQPCVAYGEDGRVTNDEMPRHYRNRGKQTLSDSTGVTIVANALPRTVSYTLSMVLTLSPLPRH